MDVSPPPEVDVSPPPEVDVRSAAFLDFPEACNGLDIQWQKYNRQANLLLRSIMAGGGAGIKNMNLHIFIAPLLLPKCNEFEM